MRQPDLNFLNNFSLRLRFYAISLSNYSLLSFFCSHSFQCCYVINLIEVISFWKILQYTYVSFRQSVTLPRVFSYPSRKYFLNDLQEICLWPPNFFSICLSSSDFSFKLFIFKWMKRKPLLLETFQFSFNPFSHGQLKNTIFENPIIPQTLNINK